MDNNLSIETNLAIEMLDTVLEAEEESDSVEIEIHSQYSPTTQLNIEIFPVVQSKQEVFAQGSPNSSLNETKNLELIDSDTLYQLKFEIENIIKQAQATVAEIEKKQLNESPSDNDEDENAFKNKKFLTHLNDLIAKSNQQTLTPMQKQSKTLERKRDDESEPNMKHSKSAPNLKLLINLSEFKDKSSEDEANIYHMLDGEDEPVVVIPPPPPVFSAELFEKIATLKHKKREAEIEEEAEQENNEETSSVEEEPVNKENFRDKLEKLLRAPPTRSSLVAPIPMPRTSLIENQTNGSYDNREQQTSCKDPDKPAYTSATLLRQRKLFDEVLKKIQKNID